MGAVFKGEGEDKPRLKLWYGGKEVLINKVFDSTRKVNDRKTREAITSFIDTLKQQCITVY